eukprot:gene3929-15255_t
MFTSAAIDNIDHNPSSSTALSAFHGTSISIFQHPKIMRRQTQLQLENDIEKSSVPLELPSYYTEICPTKSKIPEYPLQRTNTEDYSNNAQKMLEDNGWLQNLHCWESSEPNQVKTFGEYSKEVFRKAVFREFSTNGMQRVDVVFDRYISGSLKSETREGRGSGIRILVNEATPIWKNWHKFLRNDENKKELFHLLAVDLTSEFLTSRSCYRF